MRTLYIPKTLKITQEQFEQLACENRDFCLEKAATGELIIMPPTGGNTGKKNLELEGQLWLWNRQKKLGVVFPSVPILSLNCAPEPIVWSLYAKRCKNIWIMDYV